MKRNIGYSTEDRHSIAERGIAIRELLTGLAAIAVLAAIAALIVTVTNLGDGSAAAADPRSSEDAVMLRGQVVARDGEPIRGARVVSGQAHSGGLQVLHGVPVASEIKEWLEFAVTDAGGGFGLTASQVGGSPRLAVTAAGFGTARIAIEEFRRTRGEAPYQVRMEPASVVEGVVTIDGAPESNHPVVMWRDDLAPRVERTDTSGRFRFEDVALGTWSLAPGNIYEKDWDTGGAMVGEGPLPFLDAMIAAQRQVQVASAQTVQHDLELLQFGAIVKGRITIDGKEYMGVRAWLRPADDEDGWAREAWTGSSGRFWLTALPPGAYDLTITSSEGYSSLWNHRIMLSAGMTEELEIEIRLLDLAGTVSTADGRPAKGLVVGVQGRIGHPGYRTYSGSQLDDKGAFRLRGLPSGSMQILFQSEGGAGAVEPVVLVPGQTNETHIVLPIPGSVEASIVGIDDGDVFWSVAPKDVGLNLASGEGRLVDGKVTLTQVPPGALRVHVTTLDFREFEGDVTVTSGKTASVTLEAVEVEEEWE